MSKENSQLVEWPQGLQLGSLQPHYAAFLQAYHDWRFFGQRTIFESRRKATEEEIVALRELERAYRQQSSFFLQEKALIEKKMDQSGCIPGAGVWAGRSNGKRNGVKPLEK